MLLIAIEMSKIFTSYAFLDSSLNMFIKCLVHFPKFKFHDSSSGLQQMVIYYAQCLLIGFLTTMVDLACSIHLFLPMDENDPTFI